MYNKKKTTLKFTLYSQNNIHKIFRVLYDEIEAEVIETLTTIVDERKGSLRCLYTNNNIC
jgi:hypothetical protein